VGFRLKKPAFTTALVALRPEILAMLKLPLRYLIPKSEKYFMPGFVYIPFVSLRKTISRKGAKVALDSRNDDQSLINKVVTGR
jgi:hypothetical protein